MQEMGKCDADVSKTDNRKPYFSKVKNRKIIK